jgi:hypothetical protein
MSRLVARAESWERAYEAFQDINFAAFDYDTVKRSILDYVKLHFPETFNDFIESSEFVAIVEAFAYIAELMAYRIDVTAHENFISTAQRKDSILRLAKLVSYSASRALPARGLVKITSVSTTETVIDANGINLANRTIRWNDTSNSNWKDQFILVMNRVLEQEFGTVSPTDRFQIQDVLFETYTWNLTPLSNGVFTYTATINGTAAPLELIPVAYDSKLGIIERRPQNNTNFSFVYGQDGLGDGSDTTGFFCFTKQGQLQRFRTTFDGVTPNQTYDVTVSNVNDTDIWVNAVDASTGATKDEPSLLPYRRETLQGKSGEWVQVDLAHAQNVIFNTNPRRNKYEIETRSDNSVRILFGDGEFADVPNGTFDIWVRTSLDADIVVPQASVVNTPATFTYTDSFGRIQTFTFTFSLINSLQNASASETIEHVRVTAPAVYYSQDRMVNGEDYNVYMLQDPSILKLRSLNRTFAGDSKFIPWHDASTTYENVKIFGDDGILYFQNIGNTTTTPIVDLTSLITTYIEPLLSSTDIFLQLVSLGVPVASYRRVFNANERVRIQAALTPPPVPAKAELYYNLTTFEWYAIKESEDPAVALASYGWSSGQFHTTPLIIVNQSSIYETSYNVTRNARRMVFQSQTTQFWNTNQSERVIDYDTLRSSYDQVVVMQANVNYNRTGVLQQNWKFDVLSQELIDSGTNAGLPDPQRLSVIPSDENQDGIPDYLTVDEAVYHYGVADIMMPKYTTTVPSIPVNGSVDLVLPIPYLYSVDNLVRRQDNNIQNPASIDYTPDVRLYRKVSGSWVEIPNRPDAGMISIDTYWGVPKSQTQFVWNKIRLYYPIVALAVNDYVYFSRASQTSEWVPADTTVDSMAQYANDALTGTSLWKRLEGRSNLNFAWLHYSPRYHLVDPSPSNIIDTYVITKGYYMAMKRWLEDPLATAPSAVTPLELRTSYGYLLDNKMISDTVVLRPGNIKLMFGSKATAAMQATFKVIRSADKTLTDNQIKTIIVTTIRNYFDITRWEFGETFYFTELAAAIHAALPTEISSVVLVPKYESNQFGDMFQVLAREDEVLYPDISVSNVEIVSGYNSTNLRLNG